MEYKTPSETATENSSAATPEKKDAQPSTPSSPVTKLVWRDTTAEKLAKGITGGQFIGGVRLRKPQPPK